MLIKLSPYLIAMSLGLIIGMERERRDQNNLQAMGVRSFLLLSMLGAIAGGITQPLISLGLCLFAGTAIIIGYMRTSASVEDPKAGVGMTTEIAAMATFGLGYFANTEPLLSLALGVVMLLVLLHKETLHTFTKKRLKPSELQAAATLFLLAVGVIPLLPDTTIDPFNIFNPRRLGVIISLIAGIQFAGYAGARIFGRRIGLPLSGFLAGNISSTAAFVSYAKLASNKEKGVYSLASAATFAALATICQLSVLIAAVSWPLVLAILLPLSSIIAVLAVTGVLLSIKNGSILEEQEPLENPLSLLSAIKLGVLLTAIIFIVELSQKLLGKTAAQLLTFLGALFELHGVGVASANMLENDVVSLESAASTVLIALGASMVSKIFITATLGQGHYRRLMLSIIGSTLLLTIIFWLVLYFFPVLILQV